MFLQVAAKLRERSADAHFLVIGDGPLRSRLEQLTQELSLTDCVHFLGTRSDVPALLSLATVVLLTSRNEANPVSILEALACGRPVVATRVGSVPEMVLDGRVGYLVEPQDVAGMAERVAELFAAPAKAELFGATGRQHVVAHGSLERMVWGYEQLLSELYEQKTAAHHTNGGVGG
jgi:glycosyltransferase involved in cell wall biosynthesis